MPATSEAERKGTDGFKRRQPDFGHKPRVPRRECRKVNSVADTGDIAVERCSGRTRAAQGSDQKVARKGEAYPAAETRA
jgi:hypothetical protein